MKLKASSIYESTRTGKYDYGYTYRPRKVIEVNTMMVNRSDKINK